MNSQNLINNIKKIIEARGLKQRVVAEKAGFNEKEFSNMLRDRKTMKAEYILPIAEALEVTPNEIYGLPSSKHDYKAS